MGGRMSNALEDRLSDLEAQIAALRHLVLSDIVCTTKEGRRDLAATFNIAEAHSNVISRSGDTRTALVLDEMMRHVRDVIDMTGLRKRA